MTDAIPVWAEYESETQAGRGAIINRWYEAAELGRHDATRICEANFACSLLGRCGHPVSFKSEIDAGMRARANWLRSLPMIDINAIGNDYDTGTNTAQEKIDRDNSKDGAEEHENQFLGGGLL